jgi:CRP-like cAMP-binding protein
MTPAPVVISEVERLLYLKSLPLPRLDSRTLGRMAAHLSERTYSKGEVLQELNVMPTRFQVVVDGEVEILSGGGDTQTAVSRDLIGILSVMARDSRGLSAVARRKTLVLEGSTDFLLHEMQGNHAMARVAIQRICGEITRTLTSADSASDCLPTPESDLQAPSRRLDIIERLTVIRRHTRIGTFNVDALMELARRCEEIRPQPGEIIWRRGEPARAMRYLREGPGRRPSPRLRLHHDGLRPPPRELCGAVGTRTPVRRRGGDPDGDPEDRCGIPLRRAGRPPVHGCRHDRDVRAPADRHARPRATALQLVLA